MNKGKKIIPSSSCVHTTSFMHQNSRNLTPDHLILSSRHLSLTKTQKNFNKTSESILQCLTDPVLRFNQTARLYMKRRVINSLLLAVFKPGILRKLNLINLSVNFKRWLHSLKNTDCKNSLVSLTTGHEMKIWLTDSGHTQQRKHVVILTMLYLNNRSRVGSTPCKTICNISF